MLLMPARSLVSPCQTVEARSETREPAAYATMNAASVLVNCAGRSSSSCTAHTPQTWLQCGVAENLPFHSADALDKPGNVGFRRFFDFFANVVLTPRTTSTYIRPPTATPPSADDGLPVLSSASGLNNPTKWSGEKRFALGCKPSPMNTLFDN
jgi:hypothetical protein